MDPLPLRPHHPAPRFDAPTRLEGRVSLDDFRARQQNLLLFLLHGPACADCARIARELADHRAEWERWETTALALHSDPEPFPNLPIPQGYDKGAAIRRRYGADADSVAVAAMEHRGRFMDGWRLKHPDPVDWRELTETARWLAIQEPECSTCEIAPGWDDG